ncbi:Vam6/Vps39-like protein [Liparis tanakae]|uniref:Vam6/Vps39-like protein n=1 Tax=Liparis tanakae TaxID=230148 RepID=A0A4Z2FKL4_9TELE|nr:Vam6/Vps39-like protein [Liparis tanakae]
MEANLSSAASSILDVAAAAAGSPNGTEGLQIRVTLWVLLKKEDDNFWWWRVGSERSGQRGRAINLLPANTQIREIRVFLESVLAEKAQRKRCNQVLKSLLQAEFLRSESVSGEINQRFKWPFIGAEALPRMITALLVDWLPPSASTPVTFNRFPGEKKGVGKIPEVPVERESGEER